MSSARESRSLLDDQTQEDVILNAQLTGFARLTPLNTFVNISVSLVTGGILWPVVPSVWVILWTGLHVLLSLTVYMRWRRHRGRPSPRTASTRVLRKAKLWALAVGMTWGCGAEAGFCAGASAQALSRVKAEVAARLRNIRLVAGASNIRESRGRRIKPRP